MWSNFAVELEELVLYILELKFQLLARSADILWMSSLFSPAF